MAAGLEEFDWLFSVKEKPWHGIGDVIEDAPNSEEAIKIAKLDWTVKQYPVSANGKEIPNTFANIREDINLPLGVVKNRYRVMQNSEAFAFVDDIVKSQNVECKYEVAGSLFNGKKVFMVVKLPTEKVLGDDIENYLFFTNSHDGSSKMVAGISNIRVVCNNTLQVAINNSKTGGRIWSCKHTVNAQSRQLEAIHSLKLATNYMNQFKNKANEMAILTIDKDKFYKKFSGILIDNKGMSEKSVNTIVDRIDSIYKSKDDLANFTGKAWGFYNAVADFVSNSKPLKMTKTFEERKLNKFFEGYSLLETAQDILLAA